MAPATAAASDQGDDARGGEGGAEDLHAATLPTGDGANCVAVPKISCSSKREEQRDAERGDERVERRALARAAA